MEGKVHAPRLSQWPFSTKVNGREVQGSMPGSAQMIYVLRSRQMQCISFSNNQTAMHARTHGMRQDASADSARDEGLYTRELHPGVRVPTQLPLQQPSIPRYSWTPPQQPQLP